MNISQTKINNCFWKSRKRCLLKRALSEITISPAAILLLVSTMLQKGSTSQFWSYYNFSSPNLLRAVNRQPWLPRGMTRRALFIYCGFIEVVQQACSECQRMYVNSRKLSKILENSQNS